MLLRIYVYASLDRVATLNLHPLGVVSFYYHL
jgi:hypothetical protein